MSAPASVKMRATSTASRGEMPSGTQSLAEMRTDIGLWSGQTARTARNTSSGNRMRFSRLPPYSSVRLLQLEPVKADTLRHLRRAHEPVTNFIHVRARHLARRLVVRAPRNRRRRHHCPIAGRQRCIHGFPAELGRTFGTGMAKLKRNLGVGLGVNEIDNALPRGFMLWAIKPRAAGRDAALRRHAGHLRKDQPRPSFGAFGVMN